MANRKDFPGLLGSDPRDFVQDDSNTVMPLAMAPTQNTVPPILGLLDYNPDADSQAQAQAIPQAMPQLNMFAAMQNGTNGLNQLAINKINLPVTPSGEPINMVLLPDPSRDGSQPDEDDDGLVKEGLRRATGELNKIRKPIQPLLGPAWGTRN